MAAAEAQTSPRWRERGTAIAATSLLILAIVLAVVAASARSQLADERRDREDAERAARDMTTALLTYDHRDLEGWKRRVLALAAPAFRETFDRTFAESLAPAVTEAQATSSATVNDVFLTEDADGSASAIVVADTNARSTTQERAPFASYIRLDLIETDDGWRVQGVTNLNLGTPAGADRGNG